jgi:hypothetical protein
MTLIINDTKHNATQLKGFICYHSAQENCPHTECRVLNIAMLNAIMLSVVMLHAIMPSVVTNVGQYIQDVYGSSKQF